MNKPSLEQQLSYVGQVLGNHVMNTEIRLSLDLMTKELFIESPALQTDLRQTKKTINSFLNEEDRNLLYYDFRTNIQKKYSLPNNDLLYRCLYQRS